MYILPLKFYTTKSSSVWRHIIIEATIISGESLKLHLVSTINHVLWFHTYFNYLNLGCVTIFFAHKSFPRYILWMISTQQFSDVLYAVVFSFFKRIKQNILFLLQVNTQFLAMSVSTCLLIVYTSTQTSIQTHRSLTQQDLHRKTATNDILMLMCHSVLDREIV